jgi:hypothetical protein
MTAPPAIPQGGNFCVSWPTPGGTTNYVQRALTPTNTFVTISPPIIIPPGPWVATNYCDPGAVTNNPTSVYRILVQ